ncbi:MAG: hypothetical protein ACI9PY_003098 [Ascidiaceihabitans sp.]|jgi:hypothetical protein
MRTFPPLPFRVFADAENLRGCTAPFLAPRRIFRLRTFERVETAEIQTSLSLQPGSTIEERDKAA